MGFRFQRPSPKSQQPNQFANFCPPIFFQGARLTGPLKNLGDVVVDDPISIWKMNIGEFDWLDKAGKVTHSIPDWIGKVITFPKSHKHSQSFSSKSHQFFPPQIPWISPKNPPKLPPKSPNNFPYPTLRRVQHPHHAAPGLRSDETWELSQLRCWEATWRDGWRWVSGWWFQIFLEFSSLFGEVIPIWLIFVRWVETTNQVFLGGRIRYFCCFGGLSPNFDRDWQPFLGGEWNGNADPWSVLFDWKSHQNSSGTFQTGWNGHRCIIFTKFGMLPPSPSPPKKLVILVEKKIGDTDTTLRKPNSSCTPKNASSGIRWTSLPDLCQGSERCWLGGYWTRQDATGCQKDGPLRSGTVLRCFFLPRKKCWPQK